MNTLEDYQKIAYQSVSQLFNDIEQLKKKGKYVSEAQKQMFSRKVAELEQEKEDLRRKYNQLSSSTGKASEDLKNGFEQAKDVLTKSWKEAEEEFVS